MSWINKPYCEKTCLWVSDQTCLVTEGSYKAEMFRVGSLSMIKDAG